MTRIHPISAKDIEDLGRLGISDLEIERQLEIFLDPPPPVQLVRPCRSEDGITRLSGDRQAACVRGWQSLLRRGRLLKFVPASGAATRMFKDLSIDGSSASKFNASSDRLISRVSEFAFRDALDAVLNQAGLKLERETLVTQLLGTDGLGYATAPKGLILFHRYPTGPRSAMEEHLREGASYLAMPPGCARYHFTVTDSHRQAFQRQLELARESVELDQGVSIAADFSTQRPATDTIAVDGDGVPVRNHDGRLLLRPAGHGALLVNLQDLDADVVIIKNVDNIAHERLHPLSAHWKKVLAGYFAEIQDQVFRLLEALETLQDHEDILDEAEAVLRATLAIELPDDLADRGSEARKRYLIERLDRPLRVCGMVRNEGEPGGGPFWLPDRDGGFSGQIVEAAQVDFGSPGQTAIWESSTHFNPVDLICGLRDRRGRPYRLSNFVDPTTSFVAEKSHEGRPIKALERPGLWNGSMAGWNTAFVEVPLETFTPVKTVFDLLRPEHQP